MSNLLPPLWREILSRLDPPASSESIDAVHAALGGVVGRGTVQRIKDGTAETSTQALSKIARHLGCKPSELLAAAKGEKDYPAEVRGAAYSMAAARSKLAIQRLGWSNLVTADLTQIFELEVMDGAFGDGIPPGCIMTLDPARPPRAGWPVLVRDRSGQHYLRDYQQGPGTHWQAVARRRGFAPLDSEADGLQVVAVMRGVEWP